MSSGWNTKANDGRKSQEPRATRAPFRGDEHVGIVADEAALKKHPLYKAAKGGGTVAAARLASEFMGAAWLAGEGRVMLDSGARLVRRPG